MSYLIGSKAVDIPVLIGTVHVNSTARTSNRVIQRALWLQSGLGDVVLGETQANTEGSPCA